MSSKGSNTMTIDKRAVLIVLDSVGIGELPDAADFDDVGADTLGHIAQSVDGFDMPNMRSLGLGNIDGVDDLAATDEPCANFGRMNEISPGKDTTSGHWEFAGVLVDKPFRTFPDGFPADIIEEFCDRAGVDGVLGNKAASGTVIIEELGREHEATGKPIVYTSADPVFQIAACEDIVGLDTLYQWCEIAYDIVTPRGISRVIARPFVGEWPDYERTSDRKDFAFPPPKKTVMEALVEHGIDVTGVGKISDIYSGRGITDKIKTHDNDHGVEVTLECIKERSGFVFTNLVDFDSKYGHRRDPEGYARALERFDSQLPEIIDTLEDDDLLIITADHGNDPTYKGTDHTREYVPVIALVKGGGWGNDLGTRSCFSDIGATVADYFGVEWGIGESFLPALKRA
jgi:phosphopentomutase